MANVAKKLSIFPASWCVAGRDIVIVGGGDEALAKARLAIKTQARVKVIASVFSANFSGLEIEQVSAEFSYDHLRDAALVFVADDGPDGRAAIAAARALRVPLNVVDQPALCDFFTPAIIDRAPVSIAISTEGASPVLARILRAKIEAILSLHIGTLSQLAGSLRDRAAEILPNGLRRRRFFEALVTSSAVENALEQGEPDARRQAIRLLDAHAGKTGLKGTVWLIGAGPGEADLLTLRAHRLLQEADVIAHDGHVSEQVIQMGRRDAERTNISGDYRRLSTLVAQGKKVALLVAGDFSSAQVADLAALGISYQIIPGVALPTPVSDKNIQVA